MLPPSVVHAAQEYMLQNSQLGLSGWLLYDYRRSNSLFWLLVGEDVGTVTRPSFLLIPMNGEPDSSRTTWMRANSERLISNCRSTATDAAC